MKQSKSHPLSKRVNIRALLLWPRGYNTQECFVKPNLIIVDIKKEKFQIIVCIEMPIIAKINSD